MSISSGKYWTSAVTSTGDVYMWDGKNGKDKQPPPALTRLHGVKMATSVCVGETHLVVVGSLYHPAYAPDSVDKCGTVQVEELEELDEGFMFNDVESDKMVPSVQHDDSRERRKVVPSLKSLCEKVAADFLVEPRNAIQLLEIADSLEADELKKYCEVF